MDRFLRTPNRETLKKLIYEYVVEKNAPVLRTDEDVDEDIKCIIICMTHLRGEMVIYDGEDGYVEILQIDNEEIYDDPCYKTNNFSGLLDFVLECRDIAKILWAPISSSI